MSRHIHKKDGRKRKHSHHSRYKSSDDSDQSESTSDYSTESSSYDSESSVEVTKKKRRSSSDKGREKERSVSKKSKKRKEQKKKKSKHKPPKIVPSVEISDDDYYLKSAEFRTWLSKERDTYFCDLKSDESRSLFKKFVARWNKGLLDKGYYKGIQSSAVSHDIQSKYKWKFAPGVNSGELKSMRDSVSTWSAQGSEVMSTAGPSQPSTSKAFVSQPTMSRGVIGPSRGPTIGPSRGPLIEEPPYDKELEREEEHVRVKRERKKHRKQQEMVFDELLPKATGREAKIEKRRAHAEVRRAKEYSPEPAADHYVQTGPKSNIQSRIRSIQKNREKKASSAVQKISDYRAKEKARMEAILEMAKANKKEGSLW